MSHLSSFFFAEMTWLGSVSLFVLALATSTGHLVPTQSAHTRVFIILATDAGRCWNSLSAGLTRHYSVLSGSSTSTSVINFSLRCRYRHGGSNRVFT
ncbi:hypothetical protein BDP81DRAFT_412149 [Colletotrichum phormii]|uniref:Secreted protein n=1 Tax=Colletotrichum phormii TaxID=359342 RepID=A0AAJ0EJD3_9PEZI|nr:uncharacterized protein BDP81DRAFT_412149 [Colletotrichum phormii]KAK1655170.1 hypothetical protein BDP81DRAFT_412149 [Colletotrichum phormii]